MQNTNAAPPSSPSIAPVAVDTDDAYFHNGADLRAANPNLTGRWIADATMRFRVIRRHVPFGHKVIVGAVIAASIAILGVASAESFASKATTATSASASSSSSPSNTRHVLMPARVGHDTSKRARAPSTAHAQHPAVTTTTVHVKRAHSSK